MTMNICDFLLIKLSSESTQVSQATANVLLYGPTVLMPGYGQTTQELLKIQLIKQQAILYVLSRYKMDMAFRLTEGLPSNKVPHTQFWESVIDILHLLKETHRQQRVEFTDSDWVTFTEIETISGKKRATLFNLLVD